MLAALVILGAASAAPATTPAATSAPAPTAPQTLQQRFDKALELARTDDCPNAVAQFEDLKTERPFRPGSLGGSMLLVHQGICLTRLGLYDLGESRIEEGLPGLRKGGDQFAVDIAEALAALGDVDMSRWNYAGAKANYLAASAIPGGIGPMSMNIRLAKATAFDGGPEPIGYAAEAIRLAEATPGMNNDQLAALHTLHGRILLNQGQNKPGYDVLKKALKLSGGLSYKVTIADIAMRSDLAVAAQLSGDRDAARQYLVYTGAGRMPDGPFGSAVSMAPPVCGSETGLQPGDMAIVQFAINPDGQVRAATTTYSTGSGEVAAAFARAVSKWLWNPEELKAVPAFQLNAIYVELRCTETAQNVPGLLSPIRSRFAQWAADTLKLNEDSDSITAADGRSAWAKRLKQLGEPAQDANDLRTVALYGLRALAEPVSGAKLDTYFSKALTAAAAAGAPQEVVNWLEMEQAANRIAWSGTAGIPRTTVSTLTVLLNKPTIAQDPLAVTTLRVHLAGIREGRWKDYLQEAANESRLPEHHPLRQRANLDLANEAASKQDFVAAQRHFAATGLTEEQCALIGPKPDMKRTGLSSNDFPTEALRLGFEGWVRLEFDISDNGRTGDVRPIVAYPPFIFNSAAVGGLGDTVFAASYRPGGGNACNSSQLSIRFLLPH